MRLPTISWELSGGGGGCETKGAMGAKKGQGKPNGVNWGEADKLFGLMA